MRKQTYTSHVSIDIWMCVPVLDTWSQAACHVQHDPGGPVRTCSTVKQTPVLTNSLYWLVKNGIFITHNGILLESPNCSLKTLHNQGLDHCCCCLFSKALWVDWILKKAARAPLLGESPKNESSDHLWKGVYFKIQKKHHENTSGSKCWEPILVLKISSCFFFGGWDLRTSNHRSEPHPGGGTSRPVQTLHKARAPPNNLKGKSSIRKANPMFCKLEVHVHLYSISLQVFGINYIEII